MKPPAPNPGSLLLLCALLLCPVAAQASWSGTEADQMISFDDNEYARGVQILFNPWHGSLHCFWGEDAPSVHELHYGRSGDEGGTWSSSVTDRIIGFPDGNDLYDECDVAAGTASDILMVVWSESHETGREVHYGVSDDDGLTWSCQAADQILSNPASGEDSMTPSIVCDPDGVWHVVWHQQIPGGTAEVLYARSQDDGATWSSAAADRVISFPDGQDAIEPQIAASETFLYVVWREKNDADEPSVHVGISADGGDTWSSESADRVISQPVVLMTDIAISASPWVASPGIHAIYRASYNTSSPYYYEVYATSTFDNGQNWSGETEVTPVSHDEGQGRSASNPDIVVGEWHGPFVVWDEEHDTAGTKEQHFSALDGDGWTGAEADSVISFPDGENGYRPSVTVANWIASLPETGREGLPIAWVAWTEFAGGTTDNYEVHLSILSSSVGSVAGVEAVPGWQVRALPCPSPGSTWFEFSRFDGGPVTVEIFGPEGRLLRQLTQPLAPGTARLCWDGCDTRGRRVAPGRYLARAATSSARRWVALTRF